MLSICIPVFNYDVRPLVKSLQQQASSAGVPVEILLVDDASEEVFQKLNRELESLDLVFYSELSYNAGRSRIRNLLTDMVKFDWVVFMDCDSDTPDNEYIRRYLDETVNGAVVCGGRTYLPLPPQDDTLLHWHYGKKREVRNAAARSKNPYLSFMTNNFMAPKEVLQALPFNENIKGYGHEDTLFGYELMKKKVSVKHIDNPLLHIGLQPNWDFLAKTREAIKNLAFINNYLEKGHELAKMVRLLRWFRFMKNTRLCTPMALLFNQFRGRMEKNLFGRKPSLLLLDLYKLGFFCQNRHQA